MDGKEQNRRKKRGKQNKKPGSSKEDPGFDANLSQAPAGTGSFFPGRRWYTPISWRSRWASSGP